MKCTKSWLAGIVVLALVFAVAVSARAAEAGGAKDADKPKVENKDNGEETGDESAEKPQSEGAAKEKAEKTDEEKKLELLEQRLLDLQTALEFFAERRQGVLPRNIRVLVLIMKSQQRKDISTIDPFSNKKIVMNPNMAEGHAIRIRKPETFVTFYTQQEVPGKGYAVIYADKKIAYVAKKKDLEKQVKASVAPPVDPGELANMFDAQH